MLSFCNGVAGLAALAGPLRLTTHGNDSPAGSQSALHSRANELRTITIIIVHNFVAPRALAAFNGKGTPSPHDAVVCRPCSSAMGDTRPCRREGARRPDAPPMPARRD